METVIDRSRCVVVVPIYKRLEDYDENERLGFSQIFKTFVARDIVLVCPHSLSEYYKDFNRYCLDSRYFTYSGYNELCKSEFFYRMFLDLGYRYMCLVQLDVWVFSDSLEYFLKLFNQRLNKSQASKDINARVEILINDSSKPYLKIGNTTISTNETELKGATNLTSIFEGIGNYLGERLVYNNAGFVFGFLKENNIITPILLLNNLDIDYSRYKKV